VPDHVPNNCAWWIVESASVALFRGLARIGPGAIWSFFSRSGGHAPRRASPAVLALLNLAGIDVINVNYGLSWLRPTRIQGIRYVKFSAKLDF
jgi:hypothetical protein